MTAALKVVEPEEDNRAATRDIPTRIQADAITRVRNFLIGAGLSEKEIAELIETRAVIVG